MSESLVIRPIRDDERVDWEPLWAGYQEFYKAIIPPEATDATWKRFHNDAEPMYVIGAYAADKLVGIAHYIFHRSCWTVGDYCYLQDLFVSEAARGHGAGRALIAGVMERAKVAGASRVHWLTQSDNMQARALYDKVADNSGFIQYRKLF